MTPSITFANLTRRPPAQPARGIGRSSAHLTLLLTGLLLAAPLHAAELGKDFNVLNDKNIFSKNRVVFHANTQPRDPRAARTRTRTYTPVLMGAMLEDDGYVAFIVDPQSKAITTVRPGDALPSNAGTLKEVTLDYIITDPGNGKPLTRVNMGQNILGGTAEFPGPDDEANAENPNVSGPSTQPGAAAGPSAPGAGPAAPSDASVDSVVERLRKRRLQQMGK
jgi:hypothetical protein